MSKLLLLRLPSLPAAAVVLSGLLLPLLLALSSSSMSLRTMAMMASSTASPPA
jgi:hypothetical protein